MGMQVCLFLAHLQPRFTTQKILLAHISYMLPFIHYPSLNIETELKSKFSQFLQCVFYVKVQSASVNKKASFVLSSFLWSFSCVRDFKMCPRHLSFFEPTISHIRLRTFLKRHLHFHVNSSFS